LLPVVAEVVGKAHYIKLTVLYPCVHVVKRDLHGVKPFGGHGAVGGIRPNEVRSRGAVAGSKAVPAQYDQYKNNNWISHAAKIGNPLLLAQFFNNT
jgi:hypothetical protein